MKDRLKKTGQKFDLAGLNLKTPEKKFNNGAFLLSDQNNSIAKVSLYNDLEVGNTLERNTFENKSIIELIDDVLAFIQKYNSVKSEISGSPNRKDTSSYPEPAVREAVINAFAHRDYSLNSDILIVMFLDRLEITSPGALPGGLTIEDIKEGANFRRNDVVVKSLNKIGYMENYALGIPRIFREYSTFDKEPKIYNTPNLFKIVLYNRNYNIVEERTDDELKIIRALQEHGDLSRAEIDNIALLNKKKTLRILNDLIEEDVVKRIGNGKSTKYILKLPCF
ncbi:MAG: hypothetical protein GX219_08320 [Tissierellia bacterium]|nr:hypothetical protein [Tissierellia bacterium]NLM06910.1 hypothetical protein [Tissierellia bacterium]